MEVEIIELQTNIITLESQIQEMEGKMGIKELHSQDNEERSILENKVRNIK